MLQLGARQKGLRVDSASADLKVRDAELAAHAEFRKHLYLRRGAGRSCRGEREKAEPHAEQVFLVAESIGGKLARAAGDGPSSLLTLGLTSPPPDFHDASRGPSGVLV